MYRLHFHIYANVKELNELEKMLDSENVLCIKSPLLIITERCEKAYRILSVFILEKIYKTYIINRLNLMYPYFNPDERITVCGDVLSALDSLEIYEKLKKIHFGVNLHSFVRFQLSDELCDINSLIDFSCESLRAKQEYYDYIRLLKYYVNMHDSRFDTVNIVFTDNGFDILDKKLNSLAGLPFDCETASLDGDDSLISVLVDIAPKHIIIHNQEKASDTLIDTVINVFSDKVEFAK